MTLGIVTLLGMGIFIGSVYFPEQVAPIINIFGGDAPNIFGFSEQVDLGLVSKLIGVVVAIYYQTFQHIIS